MRVFFRETLTDYCRKKQGDLNKNISCVNELEKKTKKSAKYLKISIAL